MIRSIQRAALLSSHLRVRTPIDKVRGLNIIPKPPKMSHLFEADTPDEVKNAKVCNVALLDRAGKGKRVDWYRVGSSSHHPEHAQWAKGADYARGAA